MSSTKKKLYILYKTIQLFSSRGNEMKEINYLLTIHAQTTCWSTSRAVWGASVSWWTLWALADCSISASGGLSATVTGDSCLEEVQGRWLWMYWACMSGEVSGGHWSVAVRGRELMLNGLEHLLPIPTRAKMDRWRKRWYGGTRDGVKGEETKMHKTFCRHVHRQGEWHGVNDGAIIEKE